VPNRPDIGDRPISGVSFDTREAMDGKLFVPLVGTVHDGHDFLEEAVNCGAACVISERETHVDAVIVKDAAQALKDLAEYYRSLFDVKVIGITGSNGKTSTKDLVASVLSEKYRVVKTIGNFNNEIGLPTTIFNIDATTEVVVLEMGMNHSGEIHRLSKIARPDYAVITNIGVSHIENFGSQEGIFSAKSEILDYLSPMGKAFFNGDDAFLTRYRERENAVFFGYDLQNAYRPIADEITDMYGTSYTTTLKNGESVDIYVPSPGRHMVMNSLIAVALGDELGLSAAQIADGLSKFKPSGMRMSIIETDGGMRVIDDCYNASPDSMKAALEVLAKAEGNKVAILGDMLELGGASFEMHNAVGLDAARLGINTIICVGEHAEGIYEGVFSYFADGSSCDAIYYASKNECIAQLERHVRPGDTVLVKASRGMRFEEIVSRLSEM